MIIDTKVHTCRKCHSKELNKNGTNAYGNPQYHCKTYGAYGVLEPREYYTKEEKEHIIKAYQERPSMRGIERSHGVCRQTLSAWLKKAEQLPPLEAMLAPVDPKQTPVLELDELWSFVFSKDNKVWVNNTLRQHLARFVRKTLSFSKCSRMHEICLRLFLHRYNTELLPSVG